MKNILGEQMKRLRESKFPGHSLRRVGDIINEKEHFGDYFYTQLNKIETGALIPSVSLLTRILNIYKANADEKESVFQKLFIQSVMGAEEEIPIKATAVKEAFALYRRIKKEK
jgi:transcriptional regulator with XRE-family HTH domain